MGTLDHLLIAIKYTASLTTAVYGVYATVTDFHEQRDGKRSLSTKGYYGIALLVVSSLLTFSADILKDVRDTDEAKTKANEQQNARVELVRNYEKIIDGLRQDAKLTSNAISEAERAANPLGDLQVSFCLQVPLQDPRLHVYRTRLERAVPAMSGGQLPRGVSLARTENGRVLEVRFDRNSDLFPDETDQPANFLLSSADLELYFHRAAVAPNAALQAPDLRMDLSGRWASDDPARRTQLGYNLQTGSLEFCVFGISKFPQSSSGKIVAIPDLSGSQLFVMFQATYLAAMSEAQKLDLFDVRNKFEFSFLNLTVTAGRQFPIDGRELKRTTVDTGSPLYVYTFP